MRVSLLFPPQWTVAQPHFAAGALTGQLRRAGHEVIARDLNLELLEHALSETGLAHAQRRLVSEARRLSSEIAARALGRDLLGVEVAERRLAALERSAARRSDQSALRRAAAAVPHVLREARSYFHAETYVSAMAALDEALALYSASSWPTTLAWNDFRHPTASLDLEPLEALCRDARLNPTHAFFERKLPGLIELDAPFVALSISSFSQLVPGLTLALMLKTAFAALPVDRRPHLTLGGNFFSRLKDALLRKPRFFELFADSVCIGEGERTIVELAAAVEGAHDFERVPNLLHLVDGAVCATRPAPNDPMRLLASQDFEGWPLERYLAPERVLCLRASKGCYWGQCSFCDSYFGLESDEVEVDRVVAEMRHLRDRFGVRHFEFVDQCISPTYLSKLSSALLEAALDVRWFCNARTDPGFTPKLLETAHRAGLTMLMWGLESGSARILRLMRKGVQVDKRLELLRGAADAGIFNFAYVFFGFPTETAEEAQATIDLIRDNTDIIHGYGRSVFTLGRHSPLAKNPERYGILKVVEDSQDLSTNLHHEVAEGLSPSEVMAFSNRCLTQCREAYGGSPLWMALRSRETLHLYLARHGRDAVTGRQVGLGEVPSRTEQGAEFIF